MNRPLIPLLFINLVIVAVVASTARAENIDWAAVGKALGHEGNIQSGGVYRIALPRSDLEVSVDGVELKPAFALGGWVGFEAMGNETVMMGDLVLLENEINPVMNVLQNDGIEITAVHNHLLRSSPSTMYVHVAGRGDPVELATELRQALSLSKTPLTAVASPSSASPAELDTRSIDAILKAKGKSNGGVLQYSFPRAEEIEDQGMVVLPALGTAIAINFQPAGAGKAATTGDFVLIAEEVTPVMKALRESGIEVTALHSHMIDEQPRLYFMHFWGNGKPDDLAHGLREALDRVNLKGS